MNWGTVWLVAGAVALGAPSAHAQYFVRGPGVIVASDIDAPYEYGPPLPPRYAPAPYSGGPRYAPPPPPYAGEAYGPSGYATPMLHPGEIVRIARQNGFSPLGDPEPRGSVYRIAVISRDGEDGRLIIDARTGRILRFLPASEYGSRFDRGRSYASSAVGALPPPMSAEPHASLRPSTIVPPRVAAPATTVAALPKAAPSTPSPARANAPHRQADLRQAIPPAPPMALAVTTPAQQPAAPEAKPATDMPPAQGLD